MSAPEPVTVKVPDSTLAEPASCTAPMSAPVHGAGGACANTRAAWRRTTTKIHENLDTVTDVEVRMDHGTSNARATKLFEGSLSFSALCVRGARHRIEVPSPMDSLELNHSAPLQRRRLLRSSANGQGIVAIARSRVAHHGSMICVWTPRVEDRAGKWARRGRSRRRRSPP